MTGRRIAALALGAAVIIAAAPRDTRDQRDARDLARALDGLVPGAPVDCISLSDSENAEPIGDRILLYSTAGTTWRNDLAAACPNLSDDLMVTEIHGGQLCRNDHFNMVDRQSGMPSGFCRLGPFVPYRRPRRR